MADALQYLNIVGHLKKTPRTGWVYSHVDDFTRVESVADHSWRMAAAAFIFANDQSYDVGKMVQMAVLHDIAEAITGDIAPADKIEPTEKKRREAESIRTIMDSLGKYSSMGAAHALALIHEYEDRASNEAIAVKDLDLLEMILQANEYEIETGIDLSDFFRGVCGKFKTSQVAAIVVELTKQRALRIEQSPMPKEVDGTPSPKKIKGNL